MSQQKVWQINCSTFLCTLLLLAVQVQKTDTERVHYRALSSCIIRFSGIWKRYNCIVLTKQIFWILQFHQLLKFTIIKACHRPRSYLWSLGLNRHSRSTFYGAVHFRTYTGLPTVFFRSLCRTTGGTSTWSSSPSTRTTVLPRSGRTGHQPPPTRREINSQGKSNGWYVRGGGCWLITPTPL